jgi:hypothetical protein
MRTRWLVDEGASVVVDMTKASGVVAPVSSRLIEGLARLMDKVRAFGGAAARSMSVLA